MFSDLEFSDKAVQSTGILSMFSSCDALGLLTKIQTSYSLSIEILFQM